MKKLKVIELFAGVGGFRLGLEGYKGKSSSSNYTKKLSTAFEVVWSNQWEPSTKVQHASSIYDARWPNSEHSNDDIADIDVTKLPKFDRFLLDNLCPLFLKLGFGRFRRTVCIETWRQIPILH